MQKDLDEQQAMILYAFGSRQDSPFNTLLDSADREQPSVAENLEAIATSLLQEMQYFADRAATKQIAYADLVEAIQGAFPNQLTVFQDIRDYSLRFFDKPFSDNMGVTVAGQTSFGLDPAELDHHWEVVIGYSPNYTSEVRRKGKPTILISIISSPKPTR